MLSVLIRSKNTPTFILDTVRDMNGFAGCVLMWVIVHKRILRVTIWWKPLSMVLFRKCGCRLLYHYTVMSNVIF
jgi:hypothetical protein